MQRQHKNENIITPLAHGNARILVRVNLRSKVERIHATERDATRAISRRGEKPPLRLKVELPVVQRV